VQDEFFLDILTLVDATDMVSRNVVINYPLIPHSVAQDRRPQPYRGESLKKIKDFKFIRAVAYGYIQREMNTMQTEERRLYALSLYTQLQK